MHKIEGKFYSHYTGDDMVWEGISYKRAPKSTVFSNSDATVSKIRSSNGFEIKTFKNLVQYVATLGVNNSKYNLLFRGQAKDHKDRNGRTTVYPTICRPGKKENGTTRHSIYGTTVEKRWQYLNGLIDAFRHSSIPKGFFSRTHFEEYYMAIFQHYEICRTPLIDVTQSLRVAATFALRESDQGFLYVFAMPYPQGSISHIIDEEITMVKLQNVCPSSALRPHYQEGFLVGRLPFYPNKTGGDNLARRMIGKFLLDNTSDTFWDKHFIPIPNEALFPSDDSFGENLVNKTKQMVLEKGMISPN